MPCWARALDSPAPTTDTTARISVSLDIPKQKQRRSPSLQHIAEVTFLSSRNLFCKIRFVYIDLI